MIPWELEIKLKDEKQYFKFMKKVLKLDKGRNLTTEMYSRPDETDPKMQGVIVTVYLMYGYWLGRFAKIIKEVEKEKGDK